MSVVTVLPVIDQSLEHRDVVIRTGANTELRTFPANNWTNYQCMFQ